MRRSVLAVLLALTAAVGVVVSGAMPQGYAQTTGPQGDEFNSSTFAAPFHVICAPLATNCPDSSGVGTWNLNSETPGQLRIWTQFGSLLGTPSSTNPTNNARNLIVQPVNTASDWTATTKLTFPGNFSNITPLGQTAGLLAYQDADNFIFVGRVFEVVNGVGVSRLEFVREIGGTTTFTYVPEVGLVQPTVYLRLVKSGTSYQAFYSPDNVAFTPFTTPLATPTATATGGPTPTAGPTATAAPTSETTTYTAAFTSLQVGVFAFGGTNSAVANATIPADFDWFRVGTNSQTPAPTAQPTATNTAGPTSTSTAVPPTATSTAVPPTATATSTTVPPTATAVPTAIPKPPKYTLLFHSISLWYHPVRIGTSDRIIIQANHRSKLGIWAHVIFPSGVHFDYYEKTNRNGRWSKSFPIPTNAGSSHSNQAVILLQLWHGKTTVQAWLLFTLV